MFVKPCADCWFLDSVTEPAVGSVLDSGFPDSAALVRAFVRFDCGTPMNTMNT